MNPKLFDGLGFRPCAGVTPGRTPRPRAPGAGGPRRTIKCSIASPARVVGWAYPGQVLRGMIERAPRGNGRRCGSGTGGDGGGTRAAGPRVGWNRLGSSYAPTPEEDPAQLLSLLPGMENTPVARHGCTRRPTNSGARVWEGRRYSGGRLPASPLCTHGRLISWDSLDPLANPAAGGSSRPALTTSATMRRRSAQVPVPGSRSCRITHGQAAGDCQFRIIRRDRIGLSPSANRFQGHGAIAEIGPGESLAHYTSSGTIVRPGFPVR